MVKNSSKSILKLKNVSKIYEMGDEKLYALNKVSFEVIKGEFIAIVGASGSGKSTLMNIIGTLDFPSKGEIFIFEKHISSFSKDKLATFRGKEIGFVFQQYNLIQRFSAFENVGLTLDFLDYDNQTKKEKVENALKLVNILDKKNNLPTQMSGGQQQRVSIARSLVTNPSIILADEPTGALDSKTGEEILKLLNNLNEKGKTIIIITHDLKLANYAKRIIELKDGKIIKDYINLKKVKNKNK